MASVHEGIKCFKCELCDYSYSSKSNLKKHVFADKSKMNKHISSVHEGHNKVTFEV